MSKLVTFKIKNFQIGFTKRKDKLGHFWSKSGYIWGSDKEVQDQANPLPPTL